jgi:hypothetical protein
LGGSASVNGLAILSCFGDNIGAEWADTTPSVNTWDAQSAGSDTWSQPSPSSDTWTVVPSGDSVWTNQSAENNNWVRQ